MSNQTVGNIFLVKFVEESSKLTMCSKIISQSELDYLNGHKHVSIDSGNLQEFCSFTGVDTVDDFLNSCEVNQLSPEEYELVNNKLNMGTVGPDLISNVMEILNGYDELDELEDEDAIA